MTTQQTPSLHARVLKTCQWIVAARTASLEKWAAEFMKSPLHSFAWADECVAEAARLQVAKEYIAALQVNPGDDVVAALRKQTQTQINRKAQYINSQSTSALANAATRCTLAALVESLEWLES